MLSIECLEVGPFHANCYLAWSSSRQALVVDPGADAEMVFDMIARHRLDVAAYFLSHGHMDHVSALAALCDQRPAPYAMHPADCRWAFTAANQMAPYYPTPRQPASPPRFLQNNELWAIAPDLTCRIIATPGHSPGSLCAHFKDEGILFTGDTLFHDSAGRTDLPGGDSGLLMQSLAVLARLPPTTRLYPGHGSDTTLAQELRSNPFLTPRGA
ncbi:MAG: MBL fold metallo-hydrolase [Verrucomicrobia bacterium]|nr:MBL fold metallo-hydrolase [Verrucomicrobiota bacterium]MBU4247965.1 MBL fold metallo-hydrolase [Verrucomicrobiota bacterium]MBU4291462.1 MBL fold metallo-hydrolase [Verrucomicrobiota bacterium]MBU4496432.1 MBL fold metallo-hydrolase [Verrucomicrobiota bacterium]MCG2679634.1 MBL fold metallo-hydrolase [Kiritimatiellia bacterium]